MKFTRSVTMKISFIYFWGYTYKYLYSDVRFYFKLLVIICYPEQKERNKKNKEKRTIYYISMNRNLKLYNNKYGMS